MEEIKLIPFEEKYIPSGIVRDYFSRLMKKHNGILTEPDFAEMQLVIDNILTFMDKLETEVNWNFNRLLQTGYEVGYDMGYDDRDAERNYDPHSHDYEALIKKKHAL